MFGHGSARRGRRLRASDRASLADVGSVVIRVAAVLVCLQALLMFAATAGVMETLNGGSTRQALHRANLPDAFVVGVAACFTLIGFATIYGAWRLHRRSPRARTTLLVVELLAVMANARSVATLPLSLVGVAVAVAVVACLVSPPGRRYIGRRETTGPLTPA
jgi:hypothetical protein